MALERLQKIIAAAGIASRRAAEEMIQRGEVTVNGQLITELGMKADAQTDAIKVKGKLINAQLLKREMKYYLVNKPRGYVSTVSDPQGRTLVAHLLPASKRRGIHPVGRLDYNTEGLILLTNDGDLTHLLTKGGAVDKVYHVKVKGAPSDESIERLRRGLSLGQSRTAPAQISLMERTKEGGNTWFEVILREGKNQQIRKMFDKIHHSVTKLRRIRIGHLTDEGLSVGEFRELKPSEVKRFFQPVQTLAKKPKKLNTKARPGKRPNARPGARPNAHPNARTDTRPSNRPGEYSNARTDARTGVRPGDQTNERPNVRPSARATNARSGERPGPRTNARPGERPDTRTNARSGERSNARTNARSGARPSARPDARSGKRSDTRTNTRPDARTNARPSERPNTRPGKRSNTRPSARPTTHAKTRNKPR